MSEDKARQLLNIILKEKPQFKQELEKLKYSFSQQHRILVLSNSNLLIAYRELVNKGIVKRNITFENLLRTKKTRTLSGVTPVAVFTKPYPCPGQCVYCPTVDGVPKSYLPDEPAAMRAAMNDYDPVKQIHSRLQQYHNIGHSTDKIDLIIKGGTWSAYPTDYQEWFITQCYFACNHSLIKSLAFYNVDTTAKQSTPGFRETGQLLEGQQINETAAHRIIGINIETRPDLINEAEIRRLRKFGVTKVEIGVQSIYDDVLGLVNRGHGTDATVKATKLLKDAGFKVGYHMMPNLPGSNLQRDLEMFKTLFTDSDFQPDSLKIYPCVVTPHTQLYDWYKKVKYQPYTEKELVELLIETKKIVPPYVRIDRLGRDIPAPNIVAGYTKSNIRQIVHREMQKRGLRCQCIRCQEIREKPIGDTKPILKAISYFASGGQEIFLYITAPTKEKLLALLRLRITSDHRAIVRELHTYGVSLPLNEQSRGVQHQGLGKSLMEGAEKITRDKGFKKLLVISGVGAREYYRKLGYELEGTYMVKQLKTFDIVV